MRQLTRRLNPGDASQSCGKFAHSFVWRLPLPDNRTAWDEGERVIAFNSHEAKFNSHEAKRNGAKRMSTRSTISSVFEEVAVEQERKLSPLSDDLKLLHSGLDSLSFALVVARLEDALGFDPFESIDSFPVTFGDFVKLYESHQK